MNKKKILILLIVMCFGLFFPTSVFAANIYYDYDMDVDYKISDSESRTNLVYKIKDFNNSINLISMYDDTNNTYYFKYNKNDDSRNNVFVALYPDLVNTLDTIENQGNYSSSEIDTIESAINQSNNLNVSKKEYHYCEYDVTAIGVVPLILEKYQDGKLLDKKIIFGTTHYTFIIYRNYTPYYYNEKFTFSLINTIDEHVYETKYINYYGREYSYINFSDSNNNPDNIEFMKNTSYDYSDELWNGLNNIKISSSEINDQVDEIITKTNDNKAIYSKYKSNVNYRFKVKNGNGMNFKLHDVSNTFSFSSKYDKNSDTYSVIDNSSDKEYQEGIKEFSKIIVDEVKNNSFSELDNKYNSITSKDCTKNSCHIYTYIPMILEGENNNKYAKQIVLGLLDIQYRQESENDYYDISLNLYNNTCDLLNSNIDADQSALINLSRAIEKDYSSSLMNKYSDGSVALEDIYKDVDVNNLKDEYCKNVPIITLRQNPKTFTNGVYILVLVLILAIGCTTIILKRKNVKM